MKEVSEDFLGQDFSVLLCLVLDDWLLSVNVLYGFQVLFNLLWLDQNWLVILINLDADVKDLIILVYFRLCWLQVYLKILCV
jgi:hypothetical protein